MSSAALNVVAAGVGVEIALQRRIHPRRKAVPEDHDDDEHGRERNDGLQGASNSRADGRLHTSHVFAPGDLLLRQAKRNVFLAPIRPFLAGRQRG